MSGDDLDDLIVALARRTLVMANQRIVANPGDTVSVHVDLAPAIALSDGRIDFSKVLSRLAEETGFAVSHTAGSASLVLTKSNVGCSLPLVTPSALNTVTGTASDDVVELLQDLYLLQAQNMIDAAGWSRGDVAAWLSVFLELVRMLLGI